ncbi:MAG: GDP-mannose 4,6-dehydratase [Kiritimatiellae bacterium]|nr:GDP-mannose 4,6-dehydratase [Kiritimatiellia bacterium]
MKYLVTGGTAFAGSHLVQLLLREGHEVWATSRRTNGSESDVLDVLDVKEFEKVHWLFCDITHRSLCFEVMGKQQYDGVFHLAAQSHPPTGFERPFYTQEVNVVGTLNLLEALAEKQPKTHFMFCSTSEVYGAPDLKPGESITEDYPIKPINPYATSKSMIDVFFQERINNKFLNGFITRAFSHTGPKRGRIFSISSDAYQISKILAGQQEPVVSVGNIQSRRAVMDVRDCVRAYYALMSKKARGVFNVGADTAYTMEYFLDMMLKMYGLEGKVEKRVNPAFVRPIDIPVQVPDTSKLKQATGWACKIPIEQTLRDLVEYWKIRIKAGKD